jgi:hypothetical protein
VFGRLDTWKIHIQPPLIRRTNTGFAKHASFAAEPQKSSAHGKPRVDRDTGLE